MSERFYSRLAWYLFALALLVLAVGLPLWSPDKMGFYLTFSLVSTPFAVVGALVASRRPRNPIGWLFVVFGVVAAIAAFADRYVSYALVEHPGSLPGAEWVAWLSSGIWHPAFGFFVFAFLLFPDGHLPSLRWRPVALFAAANYLIGGVIGLLWGPLFGEFFPYADFPLRLPGYPIANVGFSVFLICNFGLLALSAVSLVLRLRRAAGVERQQLKWFVYAVSLFALVAPSSVVAFGDGRMLVLLLPLIPAAAGIAILRHRLYDIDVVINRTLVYGALTVSLVLVYLGSVVLLQRSLVLLSGEDSQLVIVASTLSIAALFNPLRRRIQSFLDRRFYRQKYDARKMLDEFGARLRDETDLETLGGDLVSVARETVQPAHVSLWLRAPGRRTDGKLE